MTEMVQSLRKLIPLKKYKGSGKLIWTPERLLYYKRMPPIMVTNDKVCVVRFFSKALTGVQLNWSVREKECYGIFYGVQLFEDLLDNRPFILKTDHKNLTYLNVTLTGI